jgi:hypothetical protein
MSEDKSRLIHNEVVIEGMTLKRIIEFRVGIGYSPQDKSKQVVALSLVAASGVNYDFCFTIEGGAALAQAITENINFERN